MKIVLKRQNDACHLLGSNEEGNTFDIYGAPQIGGENKGFRPMQLVAAASGSCSAMDIISILKKQKQDIRDLEVIVNAERDADRIPSLSESLHLHYVLCGTLDEKKVDKAIKLSLDKYCSVVKILEKTATITYTYEIKSTL